MGENLVEQKGTHEVIEMVGKMVKYLDQLKVDYKVDKKDTPKVVVKAIH